MGGYFADFAPRAVGGVLHGCRSGHIGPRACPGAVNDQVHRPSRGLGIMVRAVDSSVAVGFPMALVAVGVGHGPLYMVGVGAELGGDGGSASLGDGVAVEAGGTAPGGGCVAVTGYGAAGAIAHRCLAGKVRRVREILRFGVGDPFEGQRPLAGAGRRGENRSLGRVVWMVATACRGARAIVCRVAEVAPISRRRIMAFAAIPGAGESRTSPYRRRFFEVAVDVGAGSEHR